jgi:ABC-type transport system involved in Fe-S cluster assembly fused permease/ATPase subunit
MSKSAVNINDGEEQDALLQPSASSEQRRQYLTLRLTLLVTTLVNLASWIILSASSHIAWSSYHPRTSCADVVAADLLLSAFSLFAFYRNQDGLYAVGRFVAWLVLTLILSKAWMYKSWTGHPIDTTTFALVLITTVWRMVVFIQITGFYEPKVVTLRWSAAKRILRPYFIPKGLRNKIFVVLSWIVLILGKVCGILSPIVLGQIVTNLSASPPKSSLALIGYFCGLNLAPKVLSEVQDVLYVKVWQVAYAQVADDTFRHVHKLSLEWHVKKRMGNIIRAMDRGMNAADTLMYYVMIYLFPAIGSAIAAFVVFAVQFNAPEIAAVCFCAFGLYCWSTFVVTIWRRKFRQEMNQHDNEMHDKASDSLINFETVKCFTNEEHEAERYLQSVKAYQGGSYKTQASVSVLNISQATTIQLAMFGSLALSMYYIIHQEHDFDAGEFVAVQSYVLTIFAPLSFLGSIYTAIINSIVDLQNLSELLSQVPDVVDEPSATDLDLRKSPKGVSIEFRDVCFKYPTAAPGSGLKKINFKVPAGSTTALVGQTGSGKTTISRLLFRFYDVDSGVITFNGQDIRHVTQQSVRKAIGVVPQDTCLFNESVEYNIKYGKLSATREEVIDAAQKAQVHDFVTAMDKGYDSLVGERGLKVSGGEKQRIAIARCLLKDPPVVLLDEATSALDNKTEKEVQASLRCLAGRTTIIIAHRLTTVQHADQIIVLRNGQIIEMGTHDEMIAKGPASPYYNMWNAQIWEEEVKAGQGREPDFSI